MYITMKFVLLILFVIVSYCSDLVSSEIGELNCSFCKKDCFKKFSSNLSECLQTPACRLCWDKCKTHPTTANDDAIIWKLHIMSMVKQEFLVAAHIAWEPSLLLSTCIVTWEVYGGGLMGNLLAETTNIELSLWPDSKYNVRVTCTNQNTQKRVSSLPIVVDTSKAIGMSPDSSEHEYELLMGGNNNAKENTGTVASDASTQWLQQTVQETQAVTVPRIQKEIILGLCLSLVAFLGMLTIFLAARTVVRGVDKRIFNSNSHHCLRDDNTIFVVNV